MTPAVPLVAALVTVSHANLDESSMLQMPVVGNDLSTDKDSDDCRCPGYFEEQCVAEAAQGCRWSGSWCQCLGEDIRQPVDGSSVTLPPPVDDVVCCEALTASCAACSAGVSVEVYCAGSPSSFINDCPTPVDDVVCCSALTASCEACKAGVSVEDYCAGSPASFITDCLPVDCCSALMASCEACKAGVSVDEYCAGSPPDFITDCPLPVASMLSGDGSSADKDSDECRCPGYFEEQCLAEADQGCRWSGGWCQCLGEDIRQPVGGSSVTLPPPVDDVVCCEALTASCAACSAGVSVEVYCAGSPSSFINDCPTPVDDVVCCSALTASCEACKAGVSVEDYCAGSPASFITDCLPVDCCSALMASCEACKAGVSVDEYCADSPPDFITDCPAVKGPCEDYFGDLDGIVTVADPDVGHTGASAPFCESNGMSTPCIYMHLAGAANECQSPAPPDSCHRYFSVKYSECDELQNFNFDARIDTTGAFNTEGVFIACADRVISNEVHCYGPPADLPVQCDCSLAGQ